MKLELSEESYEKIDICIFEIENMAHNGIFSSLRPAQSFQQIISAARKLRQILKEALPAAPAGRPAPNGEGDAA